jgi:hypothetical protein
MSNYLNYKNGIGTTSAYQVSGRPWIRSATASGETTVEFPYVTKAFTIHSASADLDLYFNTAASATEKITVTPAQCPQRFEMKCRSVILSGSADYQMYAELTSVDDQYTLTGSGIG